MMMKRSTAKPRTAPRLVLGLAAAAGLILAVMVVGCQVIRPWPLTDSSLPPENGGKPIKASAWIGKTLPELTAKLGQPSSVQPLLQTTGQLVMYARPGQPHYVFETGPGGKIVSAASTN